jgi:hypothetical protein
MGPTPEATNAWIELLKTLVLIVVGVFIIVHETVGTDYPSALLLICAAACLGLPIAGAIQGMRNGK